MIWTLVWGEHRWTAADKTGAHDRRTAAVMGADGWYTPTDGVGSLIAHLAAFISLESGEPLARVVDDLDAMSSKVLLDALVLS